MNRHRATRGTKGHVRSVPLVRTEGPPTRAGPTTWRSSSGAAGGLGRVRGVYRAHAGQLFSVACRMVGNPADAEDLLQEIFLSAHRKLDSFRGESALGTWLYRLATNQCLDHLRSRAARTSQVTDALDDEPGLADAGAGRWRTDGDEEWISSARSRSCPTAAGRRSCCTTSKGSSTARSPRCSASPKARRSRRCTRRGCDCGRCWAVDERRLITWLPPSGGR